MDNLKNITSLVKRILIEKPDTRNSDYLLYYELCKIKNEVALNARFGTVLRNREEYGLPNIESVGRARRKIVEQYPELAGVDSVELERDLNENEFKKFARACV